MQTNFVMIGALRVKLYSVSEISKLIDSLRKKENMTLYFLEMGRILKNDLNFCCFLSAR